MGLIGPNERASTFVVLLLDMRLPDPARQLPNVEGHTEINLVASTFIGSVNCDSHYLGLERKTEVFLSSP